MVTIRKTLIDFSLPHVKALGLFCIDPTAEIYLAGMINKGLFGKLTIRDVRRVLRNTEKELFKLLRSSRSIRAYGRAEGLYMEYIMLYNYMTKEFYIPPRNLVLKMRVNPESELMLFLSSNSTDRLAIVKAFISKMNTKERQEIIALLVGSRRYSK